MPPTGMQVENIKMVDVGHFPSCNLQCVIRADLDSCRQELTKERVKLALKSEEVEQEKHTRLEDTVRWKASEQELRVVSSTSTSVPPLYLQSMFVSNFPF